jgi:hypothetical protein
MLAQINSDRVERFKIEILHIIRGRFQDDLQLSVFEQSIRVLAIAAVCGPARGLHIRHPVGIRTEDAKESFRRHGTCANLNVVWLLQHAAVLSPKCLQAKD